MNTSIAVGDTPTAATSNGQVHTALTACYPQRYFAFQTQQTRHTKILCRHLLGPSGRMYLARCDADSLNERVRLASARSVDEYDYRKEQCRLRSWSCTRARTDKTRTSAFSYKSLEPDRSTNLLGTTLRATFSVQELILATERRTWLASGGLASPLPTKCLPRRYSCTPDRQTITCQRTHVA